MKRISIVASALILLSVLWFVGCNGIFATPIGDRIKSPRDYDGKHLKISGIVTEKTSLLVAKSFVLKDKTGEIRVITDRVLPTVGDKVVVHGRPEEAFSLGSFSAPVFIEDSQGN